jgi:hypothetical protein
MKNFLAILILIFTLQTPSWGNDIRDLQIEGISIGDSLLDYMTKQEIKNEIILGSFSITDKKFQRIFKFKETFDVYEYVAAIVKPDDPKYIIYSISGMLDIPDPKVCLKKQKEIVKELSSIFIDAEITQGERPSAYDETGESKVIGVSFKLKTGFITVICYDFAEHIKKPSGLDVSLENKEFRKWLSQY